VKSGLIPGYFWANGFRRVEVLASLQDRPPPNESLRARRIGVTCQSYSTAMIGWMRAELPHVFHPAVVSYLAVWQPYGTVQKSEVHKNHDA
jgi:hypothetical protein